MAEAGRTDLFLSPGPRPRLQLALDTFDLPRALAPLQQCAGAVDVVEVGTILCLSEGMRAVREIRALFPDKPILADVRIAEAGSIISRLAFESGASLVSVVAGASDTTVRQVCRTAKEFGAQVQIELGSGLDWDQAESWRSMGVDHAILKRSRDLESSGALSGWSQEDLERVERLSRLGFLVTVTGGLKPEDVSPFYGLPVAIFIAGRSVVEADSPRAVAQEFQAQFSRGWR